MRITKGKLFLLIFLSLLVLFLLLMIVFYLLDKETPLLELSEATSGIIEKKSPANWISEDRIIIYNDRIIIFMSNTSLSRYADTNSMDPVLDSTANGIEIPVSSQDQIHVGDIITYEKNNKFIVHRVIKIGYDKQGWYCITKGDNALEDDGKIRFNQIKFITIAIIY